MTWTEGPTPTDTSPGPNEQLRLAYSTDGGNSYKFIDNTAEATDRPDYPAVAISPNGATLYQTYLAFNQPWQTTTAAPRGMEGVIRSATLGGDGTPGAFTTIHRGTTGDARGSSANALTGEFLGDYDYAAATNDHLIAVWIDDRNAADCPAIDSYREFLAGGPPAPRPAPGTDCPPTFGNSDIFGGQF